MSPIPSPSEPNLSKFLYVYLDNACVQSIEVAPGVWRLGLDKRGDVALAFDPLELALPLARLELLKDGDATIRAASQAIRLYVNNRARRQSPLSLGDELLIEGRLMIWGQRKDLTDYVLASESDTPALIVEDGPGRSARVEAVLPRADWGRPELPAASGLGGGAAETTSAGTADALKNHRQMSSLLLLSQRINALFDLDAVLEKCLESVFRLLMVDRAAILLRSEEGGPLEIKRAAYRRGKIPETIRIPESITRQAMETQSGLLARDLPNDPRYRDRPSVVEEGIQAAMAIPLAAGDRMLGILYADTSNPASRLTLDDLRFLSILANLTTTAFVNSERFGALERKARALEVSQPAFPFVAGKSEKSRETLRLLDRVAESGVTVLLTGESGVGKEIAARRLHLRSSRASKPFVAVNCAAIPESLIESELFGHDKGAFSGADALKPGRFELADGGTLLLDEIGEVPPAFQAKLLRALEGHGFERVGGAVTLKPRPRVVAATNRDLRAAVAAGTFREDLFYRLMVFPIHIPPLRERREDIMPLAEHFLARLAAEMKRPRPRLPDEARALLEAHDWPGNIRELRNLIERAIILAESNEIDLAVLRDALAPRASSSGGADKRAAAAPVKAASLEEAEEGAKMPRSLWEQEIESIREALRQSGGNRSKAARLLGISRHHLIYRIKKYSIEV
jgi:Nif-specific regulatory protein